MFAGHFGLAAIVKAKTPEIPPAALIVSSQLLDVVFLPLYAAGIETMHAVGDGRYGEQVIHADYSHSLVGSLVIAAVAGLVARWKWNTRGGLVIGAMVMSHWILDLIVHREDLPILPGNVGDLPLLGFSLWSSPTISMTLEAMLVGAGVIAYSWMILTRRVDKQLLSQRRGMFTATFVTLLLIGSLLPDMLGI